jgi:MFS transporter, MHS family, proline/betaine transporter
MKDHKEVPMRTQIALVVGNVLEWYDFIIYAYLATYIAKSIFAPGDDLAALLNSFAAFGVGFVARPVGGLVVGWIGDKRGRKPALILTAVLMAIGTIAIGLIPTYSAIGVLAPALLVLARLVQGFSAGGEMGSSIAYIVETAPDGRRGYYGSFQQCSLIAGLLLGSGVAALLSSLLDSATMQDWGWRIPFLIGGLIGPFAAYARRRISESIGYQQSAVVPMLKDGDAASVLVRTAQAFGVTILWAVGGLHIPRLHAHVYLPIRRP